MLLSKSSRNISGNTSTILDAIRILASLVVFCGHAYAQWHPNLNMKRDFIVDWGHVSVVIFFVLSGFVIAHTTTGINKGGIRYAQARLSRLYSIVLPVLIITALVECYLRYSNPLIASQYDRGGAFVRYILTALFLNEAWFLSASPPINGPLWSLSYEFWYYVIFGLTFYQPKTWRSWSVLFVAFLVVGPKILLMMPVWLLGNFAYRLQIPIKDSSIRWGIFIFFFVCAIFLAIYTPHWPYDLGKRPLFFAGQFLTDFIVGSFFALALAFIPSGNKIANTLNPHSLTTSFFRKFADLTFPLYVLHEPFLVLYRALSGIKNSNSIGMLTGMIVVFIVCMLIGAILERYRIKWIQLFQKLINRNNIFVKWILK